jgi:DNA-binding CsgD family transcriptional regulator
MGAQLLEPATDERYASWFDYVGELIAGPLRELPYAEIAQAVNRTFGAVGTADHRRGPDGVRQTIHHPGGPEPADTELNGYSATRAATEHPLLRFYLATGRHPVVTIDAVPERFADAGLKAAWFDTAATWGIGHQLALCLVQGRARSRYLVLARPEPFDPAEVAFAASLQRVLEGLWRHAGAERAWRPEPSTPRVPDVRLSARESVVLAGIGQGLTAETIARKLMISPRTVQKHAEKAYAKLGVSDRVSAVLRAQALGLL